MAFEFISLKEDSYSKRLEETKHNDIIEVEEDGKKFYRIYLNDDNLDNDFKAPIIFVQVPADRTMLLELKQYTWTLDNVEGNRKANAVYCKSEANSNEKTLSLNDMLKKYGYENGYNTKEDIRDNDIPDELYTSKRKEYKKKREMGL